MTPYRPLLLILGGLSMLAGRDASLAEVHGILVILGFVGTVVALERAVALGRPWGYLAPAGLGLGGLALLTPLPRDVGGALMLIGAAVLLGFVSSMIMAHGPIIFPAMLRHPLPYTPWTYLPAALLHASLTLRILVGDTRGIVGAVQWGGALNIAALPLFFAITIASALRSRRHDRKPVPKIGATE